MPFWNKKFGKDKVCGITMGRLRQGKDKNGVPYTVFLKCGHGFYKKPLDEWLKTSRTCPTCRTPIN